MGYWYFCATLVEIFNDHFSQSRTQLAERPIRAEGTLEQLAVARSEFSVSPALAWRRISDFRSFWKLRPLDVDGPTLVSPPDDNSSSQDGEAATGGTGDERA